MEKKDNLKFIEIFKSDFKRSSRAALRQGKTLSVVQIIFHILTSKTLPAIAVYRLRFITEQLSGGVFKAIFSTILSALNVCVRAAYGIDIDRCAKIGKALYIGHFGGIRIGRCSIGDYCSLHHQVEIGLQSDDTQPGPIIGDRVWIGAHVKIQGSVIVEGYSTIVPGSVVKTHVPAHALVMGRPARVIASRYNNDFLL